MATFTLPNKLLLQVVTPERAVIHEEVDEVLLPGSQGYLGVLPGHTPLLTSLKIGEIKYRKGTKTSFLAVFWGFVEILPDKVTVLAELAERPDEIDVASAQEAKARAEKMLREPENDYKKALAALEQALVRIQVASKGAPTATR